MGTWREIPVSTIGKGTYRLTFTNYYGILPKVEAPKSFTLLGNVLTLVSYEQNKETGEFVAVIKWETFDTVQKIVPGTEGRPATSVTVRTNVNQNTLSTEAVQIPAAAIVLGVAAVFGIVAYFNLQKVEELVDNPSVSLFVAAVAVVAVVMVFRNLKG